MRSAGTIVSLAIKHFVVRHTRTTTHSQYHSSSSNTNSRFALEHRYDNRALNLVPFDPACDSWIFGGLEKLYLTPTLITLFISPDGLYKMSTRFMLNMFAGENKFVDLRYAWRCFTIEGGTNVWIQKMVQPFRNHIRTNCGVKRVIKASEKTNGKVRLELENGTVEEFDHVLIALGGATAALLLDREEMSYVEKNIFDAIEYATERVVLHTDQSFVPSDPKMKRNFNYVHYKGMKEPMLTGLLHEISKQPKVDPCPILTMNPVREPKNIIHERYCSVHVQDLKPWLPRKSFYPPFKVLVVFGIADPGRTGSVTLGVSMLV